MMCILPYRIFRRTEAKERALRRSTMQCIFLSLNEKYAEHRVNTCPPSAGSASRCRVDEAEGRCDGRARQQLRVRQPLRRFLGAGRSRALDLRGTLRCGRPRFEGGNTKTGHTYLVCTASNIRTLNFHELSQ